MAENTRVWECLGRSHMYGLLARLMRAELDADMLAALRQPDMVEALQELGVDVEAVLAAGDDAQLMEDLATQYTYLLLLTLNPHESVQRGEGRLWGDHTVAASAFLEELGLGIAVESLLPDHIAVELEVMQHLTASEAAALEAQDQAKAAEWRELAQRYLKAHLGAWGVPFFASVGHLASHSFYQAVGQVGQSFLYTETADPA